VILDTSHQHVLDTAPYQSRKHAANRLSRC
jgi:hypothetical protein